MLDITTQKAELEKLIAIKIIEAAESKKITDSDIPLISEFVTNRLQLVYNNSTMQFFLRELSSKWLFFEFSNISLQNTPVFNPQKNLNTQTADEALRLLEKGDLKEVYNLIRKGREN